MRCTVALLPSAGTCSNIMVSVLYEPPSRVVPSWASSALVAGITVVVTDDQDVLRAAVDVLRPGRGMTADVHALDAAGEMAVGRPAPAATQQHRQRQPRGHDLDAEQGSACGSATSVTAFFGCPPAPEAA